MSCSGGSSAEGVSKGDALHVDTVVNDPNAPAPMDISPMVSTDEGVVSTDEGEDEAITYDAEVAGQGRWWRHTCPRLLTFPHTSICSPARQSGD
jgi:hypothetical protein